MTLEALVAMARREGASDLHLEPGLPAGVRVRGDLRLVGEPLSAADLQGMAQSLLTPARWDVFMQRHAFDLSRPIAGVRCRINIMRTNRGIGLALRLLSSFHATLKKLNLHPDLGNLLKNTHGLILIAGPTGSGKSTTLAALLQEINLAETRHIITIEHPIEYTLVPRKSFIRQREVGRDTPSVEQALMDALREDPDVLMVGELRDPESMRLTLSASETGHLVFATLHSATCAEALQRLVGAFAPDIQPSVCAQLADALVACVCQRLTYRADLQITVPECEILVANTAVRSILRQGNFAQLQTALETGGGEGNFTFARYRAWLDRYKDFTVVKPSETELSGDDESDAEVFAQPPPPASGRIAPASGKGAPRVSAAASNPGAPPARNVDDNFPSADSDKPWRPGRAAAEERVLVISEDEGDPAAILSELEKRR